MYAALSADSSSSQGLNPSGVLFDEVAEQRNMELWGALTTGSDTRRQPLFVAIGTAGVTGESPLAEHLFNYSRQVQNGIFDDPTFLPMMYTIPDGADWTEEETWRICNPALCDGGFSSKSIRSGNTLSVQLGSPVRKLNSSATAEHVRSTVGTLDSA